MSHFPAFTSRVVPLLVNDIDTDQIIPARFLKVTDKSGLGQQLFADWRYADDGSMNPDFVLNKPEHQGAGILLTGCNFGCGSSREHAPWALVAHGFKAVISPSFADIFRNNALKNGLLPIVVEPSVHQGLVSLVRRVPEIKVTVDLESQTVSPPGAGRIIFPIHGFSKKCLLNGIDELGYIQGFERQIAAFEMKQEAVNLRGEERTS